MDTLRCNFYMAVLAAIDKDEESYRKYRDLCLHDEMLRTVSITATTMFHLIDDIMDGSINDKEFEEIGELSTMREMKFVVNITEIYGHEHTAFILEKHLMELVEQHFSKSNQMNMAELDARMGNKILSANLEQKSKQLERTSLTLSIVVVIVLLGLLAFAYSQVISLRRRRLRDQKMINELTEANRKAEIANAAKTRFVQNMSHEVRTPLEPFTFRTDPQRVQQILINLLTNACKHTSQGEIVLSSSTTAREGFVTFSVTDTGPGIPADKAEAIFDRFTKLNGFVQGTGLGLSICREIATLMGSNVYLDTSYSKGGARFVLEVPIVPPEHQNG